ncbi:uncharacterized protein SPPG_05313 [Spizellomyces punctatus DAOM BR117]|uniref:MEKHLA domain-containing protein n=1 Tax=Spizellomyces punctatus (strain DAOM BR117) TaxID=645134 RepID=A0A0L0HEQ2_SPIPD|nr:uncharacterized protein SPPG_05313 [Spizellomyces punctatus DAOM BR117]KNC99940.1 hypothetical protein SPPG_05313 [Spizellomyces punctatus DAOM BR117]|eukprot:XP_016607980.1 hypothetical protein SPPG_05313 [Spizellomyces punctatus DAOM BR117]
MWYHTPTTLGNVHRAIVSFHHYFNQTLVPFTARPSKNELLKVADTVYALPFIFLTHTGTPTGGHDPIYNFGNEKALSVFGRTPAELLQFPSRLSAGPDERTRREDFMREVAVKGCVKDYDCIRVKKDGSPLKMWDGYVWNVRDESGEIVGQAAMFKKWQDQ